MLRITLDAETCPTQCPLVKADIADGITPPGNMTKADTIALWNIEKKPAAVEEAIRKTSLDGAYGHICVLGLGLGDEKPVALYDKNWLASEADILKDFFARIEHYTKKHQSLRPRFVGHNHTGFDLRFIFQRACVLGVKPCPIIPFHANPWDVNVFDTMFQWAGRNNYVSLDKLSRIFGMKPKGDLDGSKVWDYVQQGRIAEVAEYCADDIERVRGIHQRMSFSYEAAA